MSRVVVSRALLASLAIVAAPLLWTPVAVAQPLAWAPPGARSEPLFQQQLREPDAAEAPADNVDTPAHLRRQVVNYDTREAAGTIVIDTPNTYLYYVLGNGRAIRYGIGVGRDGFRWSGVESITRMAEWPDWHPPAEMIGRQPYLPRFMAGGESNPLGARALYLGSSTYRIHGTNAPSTIGQRVSSGCIRLQNDDIVDLYKRVRTGTKVVVLPDRARQQPTAAVRSAPVITASTATLATPANLQPRPAAASARESVPVSLQPSAYRIY
jgi:lipoprotein-anchoring transpeptidase ErfK/SrfK